ncbi:MAG: MDR family oxidoreductase [Alphaproteobacteria bacterium]
MAQGKFRAVLLDEAEGKVTASVQELDDARLPAGDVTIRVAYSTLNYKDGMVLSGIGRLVRAYPHVPGIDLAGTVEASDSPDFAPGDEVLCTGYRLGEVHWGGYAQRARLPAKWLVKLPEGLTVKRAMAIGTAGFTAMQSILALEKQGLTPAGEAEILVTGATGGVGSIAVAVLAKLGYRVAGSTGKAAEHDYLRSLGATTVIDRKELSEPSKRPLVSERWDGAIDSVGSHTLANVLASMKYGRSVAACGLAQGNDLPTTVIPFILRGVNLLGIESVMCPMPLRRAIWSRLVTDLPADKLDAATRVVPLEQVVAEGAGILKGAVRGRIVVDVNA